MGVSCSDSNSILVKEGIIKQEHIIGRPRSLSRKELIRIFEQMEYSIYKIVKENLTGTGFICRIPYPNELHKLPVLITCNHVLDEEDIKEGKEIKLFLNETEHIIKIDAKRKVYTDKEYDITIIELEKEEYMMKYLLDIDSDINKDINLNNIFKNETIYILHYPEGKDIEYSLDTIKKINDNNKIDHNCCTKYGSSGGPIIILKSFKIIGVHTGTCKSKKWNSGIILKNAIISFNNKYPSEILSNEIKLKVYVGHSDVNKEVYFLDDFDITDEPKEKHNHLKELNETNTKIIIDDKEYKFCKYFVPEEEGLYMITIKMEILITDCTYMFSECSCIVDFDLSNFNTSCVTNMSYMFSGCQGIREIDLSNFNTDNVTDMSYMLQRCRNLKELDLSFFKTTKVTNMKNMFCFCLNLRRINLLSFDTKNVRNMSGMFTSCGSLNGIDLSSFEGKNVTDVSSMFFGCENLMLIEFFNFGGENITTMERMFLRCTYLRKINNFSSFNTKNVTNMSSLFYGCQSLVDLDLCFFNTENVVNMNGMFFCCVSLMRINIKSFNTKKVEDMSEMFTLCKSLKLISLEYFDILDNTKITNIFGGCQNIKVLINSKYSKKSDDFIKECQKLYY